MHHIARKEKRSLTSILGNVVLDSRIAIKNDCFVTSYDPIYAIVQAVRNDFYSMDES